MGPTQASRHLHGERPCVTVSGVVESTSQLDGSYRRLLVHLDDLYSNLLAEGNFKLASDFVIDEACQPAPTPGSAKETCTGAAGAIPLPRRGDHIYATGAYVANLGQGWRGLFPVYTLEIG